MDKSPTPAERAFLEHRDACDICREAASHRQACDEGVRLHEEAVLAAHREQA